MSVDRDYYAALVLYLVKNSFFSKRFLAFDLLHDSVFSIAGRIHLWEAC